MAEPKQSDQATQASQAAPRGARAAANAAPTESTPEPVKDAGFRGEGVDKGELAEGQAVVSTTKEVPHEADATSAPGPYNDLPIDRPPVSTSNPQEPIAQSLVEGAGAGNQGQPEIPPEKRRPENTENV